MRINEDFLDDLEQGDIALDNISVVDDVCNELNDWLFAEGWARAMNKRPSFDPQVLPDKFYPVNNRQLTRALIYNITATLGNDCNLNWLYVSEVTSMRSLFAHMSFNGDISRWDVSNVEDMTSMFEHSKFNGNISGWDVSSVRYMSNIFDWCPFCQDISSWNCASMEPELLKDALKGSNIPRKFKPKTSKQS